MFQSDPRADYSARLAQFLRERDRLARADRVVCVGMVIAVLVAAAPPALTLSLGPPIWFLSALAVFLVLLWRQRRVRRALARTVRLIDYYQRGLARLDGRWPGTGSPGDEFMPADHPYAADLDIFGVGSLFERLNTARTAAGARTLGAWLLAPASLADIRSRQEAIDEMRAQLDLREELHVHSGAVPAGIDLDALIRWGNEPSLLPSLGRASLLWALAAIAGVAVIVPLSVNCTSGILQGILLGQAVFCWYFSKQVGQVVLALKRRSRDLLSFHGILQCIERRTFSAPALAQVQAALSMGGRPPSQAIRRLARLAESLQVMEYPEWRWAGWLVMLTTRVAFRLESWRRTHGPHIARWLDTVAHFEALSSLATYAYENPDDPFAEYTPSAPCFEAQSLGHPLLPGSARNDISLGHARRGFVITGSNMSGKSTLLRTVGVNVVLALAGAPVRAEKLRLSPVAIAASIRVQDSLQAGRSRFLAEIRKLRQMLDITLAGASGCPLLFLIDEILQGTNPVDRQIGAAAVVLELLERGAIGLVTTHDLPLTTLPDRSDGRLANIHFADHLENGQPCFDYKIRPGVVERSNALDLMRTIGISV